MTSSTVEISSEKNGIGTTENAFTPNPKPILRGVTPTEGPQDGGVRIMINGENLGFSSADITSIEVGGIPCTEIEWMNSYNVSCVTGQNPVAETRQLVLKSYRAGVSTTAMTQDYFGMTIPAAVYTTNPRPLVTGLNPESGPRLGGSSVLVTGSNLGRSLNDISEVYMLDYNGIKAPCPIIERSSSARLTCRTTEASVAGGSQPIIVTKAGGVGQTNVNYTMNNEPLITAMDMSSVSIASLASGTQVELTGNYFAKDNADLVSVIVAGATSVYNEILAGGDYVNGQVLRVTLPSSCSAPCVVDTPGVIQVTSNSGGTGNSSDLFTFTS